MTLAGALVAVWMLAAPPSDAPPDPGPTTDPTAGPMSVEDCVRVALVESPQIEGAQARVAQWQARLAQVESLFYPKLAGMAYIAPINTVRGSALSADVERDFSLKAWGPYTHLEVTLAQPLYTFGRAARGKEAARERRRVEEARVRETRNAVAMEVKRMYYAHLYARSLMPTLRNVAEIVSGASEQAQELYAENTGKVTKADLMRLEYASIEVEKLRLRAKDGAELALAALKHTMGWPMGRALVVDRKKLPRVPKGDAPDLASLIHQSAAQRPEWAQLKHGEKAAIALEAAERLANAPVLFLAGRLELDWAPTRQDTPNPYHFDEFNDFSGGLALGLLFNLDPALAAAKGDEAAGIRAEVLALRRFAATGIPLQVRKAHDEVRQAAKVAKLSRKAVKVTRRWVTFSALAHQSGTGEAKELLEGVAAWVTAKNDYYDALRAYYTARAELDYAVGQIMGPKVPGT